MAADYHAVKANTNVALPAVLPASPRVAFSMFYLLFYEMLQPPLSTGYGPRQQCASSSFLTIILIRVCTPPLQPDDGRLGIRRIYCRDFRFIYFAMMMLPALLSLLLRFSAASASVYAILRFIGRRAREAVDRRHFDVGFSFSDRFADSFIFAPASPRRAAIESAVVKNTDSLRQYEDEDGNNTTISRSNIAIDW